MLRMAMLMRDGSMFLAAGHIAGIEVESTRLIKRAWPAVVQVARALELRGTLTRAYVRELVKRSSRLGLIIAHWSSS
jgi:hypothetical protein